jgi:hypothetical protein
VEPIDAERSRLFGGCFALLDGQHFATPHHVVTWALEHERAEGLHVCGSLAPVPVEGMFAYPTADLAVPRAPHDSHGEPFAEPGTPILGETVTLSSWRLIS